MPRVPPATMPTTIDVVSEELCTREVVKIPMNSPHRGFDVKANI